MKVSRLHIRNYQQIKDLELDLTYPAGHAKAGQPLDKACIIGQSGTGKTTLLKIIREFVGMRTPTFVEDGGRLGAIRAATMSNAGFTKQYSDDKHELALFLPNGKNRVLATGSVNKQLAEYYQNDLRYLYFPAELSMDFSQIFPQKEKPENPLDNFMTAPSVKKEAILPLFFVL